MIELEPKDLSRIEILGFYKPLLRIQESSSLAEIIKAIEERGYSTRHICQTPYYRDNGHLEICRRNERIGLIRSESEDGKVKYALYLMIEKAETF